MARLRSLTCVFQALSGHWNSSPSQNDTGVSLKSGSASYRRNARVTICRRQTSSDFFIDDLEFLEGEGLHVGIQAVPGDEVHLASARDLKFVVQRKELEQAHRLLENHEDIHIALRRILVAGDRSKDTGALHNVTFVDWGRFRRGRISWDLTDKKSWQWLGKVNPPALQSASSQRAGLLQIKNHYCNNVPHST